MCLPLCQPRDDPSTSRVASRAIPWVSRTSKWLVASLGEGKAASSCAPSMPDTVRMLFFCEDKKNCTWSGN